MPVWHAKTDSFESGFFEGMVFVVDPIENKVLCHAPIRAESADAVSYRTRGLLREKPETALKDDFQNRIQKELTAAIPDAASIGNVGTIF